MWSTRIQYIQRNNNKLICFAQIGISWGTVVCFQGCLASHMFYTVLKSPVEQDFNTKSLVATWFICHSAARITICSESDNLMSVICAQQLRSLIPVIPVTSKGNRKKGISGLVAYWEDMLLCCVYCSVKQGWISPVLTATFPKLLLFLVFHELKVYDGRIHYEPPPQRLVLYTAGLSPPAE